MASLITGLVIDGFSNNITTTITVGDYPLGVGVNPTTNRIYVANGDSYNVSVIDGNTKSIIATVGVGELPYGVGVDYLTNGIYVANRSSGNVSVISGNRNTVIANINVGGAANPNAVGVNPLRMIKLNQLYHNFERYL